MEEIGLAFILLSLFAYLLNDDFLSHILGAIFFTSGVGFYLLSLNSSGNQIFNEELVIFLYMALNILIVTGLFIFKDFIKTDKVDEIK